MATAVVDNRQPTLLSSRTSATAHRIGRSVSINGTHKSSKSSKGPRIPAIVIIASIAIVYRLATTLLTTTNLRIVHTVACQIWYQRNKPDAFPDVQIPEGLCVTPEVDQYYAALVSMLTIVDGLGGIFGTGASSYLASRFGRKPVLLGLLICTLIDQLCILSFQFLRGRKQLAVFAIILFIETIGNANTTIFLVSMFVVDVSEAEERTAALSAIGGWVVLGGALGYSLGGYITTKAQNDAAVYIVSLSMVAMIVISTAFFLPESFPADKRELLRLERLAETSSIAGTPSWTQRFKTSTAIIFEPLQLLKPTINPLTGKTNWRLVWCTAHIVIVTLADAYALPAMMVFFTTQYKYTPAQAGYVLTTFSLSSVVVLTIVLPLLIRFLKPLYNRNQPKLPFTVVEEEEHEILIEDHDGESSGISEPEVPLEEVVSETCDHMDVHITIVSWAIESLAFITLGAMRTFAGQIAAVAWVGFGSGRVPAFRSLVVASVEPLKQGEAMASVEMMANVGKLFSPILMGYVMTATISTSPQLIFYIHAAIVSAGAAVLFLVRNSDRYQKPAIALGSED